MKTLRVQNTGGLPNNTIVSTLSGKPFKIYGLWVQVLPTGTDSGVGFNFIADSQANQDDTVLNSNTNTFATTYNVVKEVNGFIQLDGVETAEIALFFPAASAIHILYEL